MRTCVKVRALAAVIAVVAAGGCSAALAASYPRASGGLAGYWTRAVLVGARPARARVPAGTVCHRAPGPGEPSCRSAVRTRRLRQPFLHRERGGEPGTEPADHRRSLHQRREGRRLPPRHRFIPGYRDGQAPYGIWAPAQLIVAPQWTSSSDPDFDVGFVVLKPSDGTNIEDVLGADQLGIDSGYRNLVRVTGYPASADAPITCINRTSEQNPSQLRFECDGFTGGTSGSPWVTHFDSRTRTGTIVGVLGGYEEGGSTAAISYSPYLGPEVQRLYRLAASGSGAPLADHAGGLRAQ